MADQGLSERAAPLLSAGAGKTGALLGWGQYWMPIDARFGRWRTPMDSRLALEATYAEGGYSHAKLRAAQALEERSETVHVAVL